MQITSGNNLMWCAQGAPPLEGFLTCPGKSAALFNRVQNDSLFMLDLYSK